MPYIQIKTTEKITKEKEELLKTGLGKAIELIPGKSEGWLMLSFEGERDLYFKGKNDQPIAFVEVKLFGRADKTAYGKLTASVTELLNRELGISPGQIYVQYEETAHWGWNGSNL